MNIEVKMVSNGFVIFPDCYGDANIRTSQNVHVAKSTGELAEILTKIYDEHAEAKKAKTCTCKK